MFDEVVTDNKVALWDVESLSLRNKKLNLDSLKICELKMLLLEYGNPVSGKKKDLVTRLWKAQVEQERIKIKSNLYLSKLLRR